MSEFTWETAIASYVPPVGTWRVSDIADSPTWRKAEIETTDEYGYTTLARVEILKRHKGHPAVDLDKLIRMMNNVDRAPDEKGAHLAFDMFELEIEGQLDDLRDTAWEGATPEDIEFRDGCSS